MLFSNRSGAFLILKDRLSETSSETGTIEDPVFGVNNSTDRFCAVCLEKGGVLETSKIGVFLF